MTIKTLDMHTGGEPLRIIRDGLPEIPGKTVLERRRHFRDHLDHIRTGLMWEPRGHADMYGVVITPPNDGEADFGAFFLHNEGYSTMCGHAVIALARYAYENQLVTKPEMFIDVPAGRIHASVTVRNGKYHESSFRNVPSFVFLEKGQIFIEEIGEINFSIAFGGAFYALVNADVLKIKMIPENAQEFVDLGRRIKQSIISQNKIQHPFESDLSFLYGVIFTGAPEDPGHHSRNVCIFADGELDRSSTGSGVSARAAYHFLKGELRMNEKITIESIIGTQMDVKIIDTVVFGGYNAVIPEVSGNAYYTGEHRFIFEDDDGLRGGFLIR